MNSLAATLLLLSAPKTPLEAVNLLKNRGLSQLGAYQLLGRLTGEVGARLNGSEAQAHAVTWAEQVMRSSGFQNVHRQPCKVPHWVRGSVEKCEVVGGPSLTCCALGNSAGTTEGGVTAEVVQVKSLKEVETLGEKVRGKIVFYNRPFDPTLVSPGAAYGTAGDQRFRGPAVAAKYGAAGVLVRSMTGDHDDVPHTGTTVFDGDKRIPAVALSLVAADRLTEACDSSPAAKVHLELSCQTLPDADSANVIGEIVGSEKPNEVIVVGGHLDSWDKGQGAHDDGAGVVHALEALRLIRECGLRPKRTIRVVLWVDEENRGSGAKAYLEYAKTAKEKQYAAIESDSGGFTPRGFGTSLKGSGAAKLVRWVPVFDVIESNRFTVGGDTGADIEDLAQLGTVLFGLDVDLQRYFDYHHSDKDTIDKVHPRELELGAISMALLAWLISENGV